MGWTHAFAYSLGILIIAASSRAATQELPTSLTCTSNAKASRDYGLAEKRWSGQMGHLVEPSRSFAIGTANSKTSWGQFELRDKMFSGLNSQNPIVRSITRYEKGPEAAAEFSATVLGRSFDAVFLAWTNDFNNKVWLATVDLVHRKATVTQVFRGATSVGGEIETLDCR
jgi:hypothetical protein